jgi:hypothetical protein
LQQVAFDLVAFTVARGAPGRINQDDLVRIAQSPFAYLGSWVIEYVERGRLWLTVKALNWLFVTYDEERITLVKEFRERAEEHAMLAAVATMHGRTVEAVRYVRSVAEHVVAYIDHKDLLLYELLDAAHACHRSRSGDARRWLIELAPAIACVAEFTDGDETSDTPRELGKVLAAVAPDLLPRYYRWLAACEHYYVAQAVFRHFLGTLDLADPVARAIAQTATDEATLSIVRERARSGDAGAHAALDKVAEVLGGHACEEPPSAPRQDDTPTRSTSAGPETEAEDAGTDPTAYPPGRLREFLANEPSPPYYQRERAEIWLDHWRAAGYADAALTDAERLVNAGAHLGSADPLYALARTARGRNAAYPWFVRAYREGWYWETFGTSEETAEQRWATVQRDYPERWLNFLRDTLLGPDTTPWAGVAVRAKLPRLVRYLIRLGQPELAAEVTERSVRMTLELVSPAPADLPGWVVSP